MATVKRWSVEIFIDESDGRTRAEARLHTGVDTHLVGIGRAQLDPAGHDIPEIGDEFAVARALSDLGHRLLITAAGDVAAVTAQTARLSG